MRCLQPLGQVRISMMHMALPLLASAFVLTGGMASYSAAAQALEVTVEGLRNAKGDVVVCVWRQDDAGFPNCAKGRPWKKTAVPATSPAVRFDNVPSGTYAVTMFHDENRAGRPTTNFMGLPTSAVGLANNPQVGPTNRPTFDKARVRVPRDGPVNIIAKYIF